MATSESDTNPIRLAKTAIQPVGFSDSEGLLPYPDSSFIGYRLLTEYFAFPEKFMFFDLSGIADRIPQQCTNRLEFYIYLSDSDVELEHNVSVDTFQLGCVPAVNLFEHRADPIKLDHTSVEYEVVADARRPDGYEIYSIESVNASSSSGGVETYLPLYGIRHDDQSRDNHTYWFSSRRHAKLGNHLRDEASDVFVSLADINFNPDMPDDRTLSLNTVCSNRNQPARLPFSTEQPRFHCVESAPPCTQIRCLMPTDRQRKATFT